MLPSSGLLLGSLLWEAQTWKWLGEDSLILLTFPYSIFSGNMKSVGGLCSLLFSSILPRCLSVFFSLLSSCNHKNQQYVFIKQEWGSLFLCALILLTDTQGELSDIWGWTVTGARRTRGTEETSSHKLRYLFPQNTVKV